jgi:hypothetical protein
LIFPLFIVAFWFSKKDFFWIAFFFVLAESPASFFSDWSRDALHRIPMYTFLPGLSFSILDLFVVVALLKSFLKGTREKLALKTPYALVLGYLLFSAMISVLRGGDIGTLANAIRGPFYYALLLPVFYLIKSKREAYSFIALVAPFSVFVFFSQLYLLSTGNEFINLFVPGYRGTIFIEGTGEIRAMAAGFLLVFFSFVFSLFLLNKKGSGIPRNLLLVMIGVGYLSVIFSATRIWFVVLSFVLAGYFFVSRKSASSLLRIAGVLVLMVAVLVASGVTTERSLLEGPLSRLSSGGTVMKGGISTVPTLAFRYNERLPRVLEGIGGSKNDLIFGCGFTEHYYKYYDYHVGFFNTILQFGVLGFLVFMYFFASYFLVIKRTVSRLSPSNPFRTALKVLPLAFAGMLLANFTIWYFFPMDSTISQPYFVAAFLGLTEVFIREAKKDEEKA